MELEDRKHLLDQGTSVFVCAYRGREHQRTRERGGGKKRPRVAQKEEEDGEEEEEEGEEGEDTLQKADDYLHIRRHVLQS
jgi:hypothetical protein